MLGKLANRLLRPLGVRLVAIPQQRQAEQNTGRLFQAADYPDFETFHCTIIQKVYPFTMTSPERLYSLINAVQYVVQHNIPGDIVECGVWRGGSMMAVAETLLAMGMCDRNLYMYDTYEGMSAPTEHDKDFGNNAAEKLLLESEAGVSYDNIWCVAGLQDVQANMQATGYPTHKLHFIKGKVEDTLPGNIPLHPGIALLRLDTDWYESTRVEMEQLYKLVVPAGFIIADDYGHWQGAKQAVDEYFNSLEQPPFLHRIDYTGRMLQKNVSKP